MRSGSILMSLAAVLLTAGTLAAGGAPPLSTQAAVALAVKAAGLFLVVPGLIRLAFAYWRTRDAARPEMPPAAGTPLLPCPACRRLTSSLKQVLLPDLTFLLVAWRMSSTRYTRCPACTRAIVEEYLLRNLLSANVLWPAPAIHGAVALAASFAPGHSRGIVRDLRPTTEAQPQWATSNRG